MNSRLRSVLWVGLVLILVWASPVVAQQAEPSVLVLEANGELTITMVEYLNRGIRQGEEQNAEAVIVLLNTPGGSLDLMNRIVELIRSSHVPVIVYVSPRGAIAGSAGTVITLAGHAAAMAPETAIGAASPVGGQGEDIGETEETKVKEIMKATVRSLAERRSAEAVALAEDTIENAKAVSSSEALQIGLIDFIAKDQEDLLQQLDGFRVETIDGEWILNTANATRTPVQRTLIEQLLQVLVNPNIVFLLLTVGVQAILIELSSPGGWVAGFIGVVSLALAIYGLGILPVNWFGIIFLVTAFVLFLLDIKAPTHGALTAAGVGSFIVGALVLFNSPSVPSIQRVSVPLVIVTAVITAATFFAIVSFGIRAQKIPIMSGQESLSGRRGVVRSDMNPEGTVQVAGELWSAQLSPGEEPIERGAAIEVVAVEGIRLLVRRV